MYTYIADETKPGNNCNFFLFGGITITEAVITEINEQINHLKKTLLSFPIPPHIEIKWNYKQTLKLFQKEGKNITEEEHTKFKNELINYISSKSREELGIILYLVPKEYFLNDGWKSYYFAMNICFGKYELFLRSHNAYGTILIDEFEGIKEKDVNGQEVVLDRQKIRNRLQSYILSLYLNGTGRVMMQHIPIIIPNINSTLSNSHQLNDLILGAFQYYLQYKSLPGPEKNLAVSIVKKFVKNFHVNYIHPTDIPALNKGILIYPKNGSIAEISALKLSLKQDFNII